MTITDATTALQELCPGLPVVADDQRAVFTELAAWATELRMTSGSGAAVSGEALARMLVHSRYLQGLAKRHPDDIGPVLQGLGAQIVDAACEDLRRAEPDMPDETQFMAAVRRLRQRSALAVALSDLAGKADVATQMSWLSQAADAAVRATVSHLFARAAQRRKCPPPAPDMAGCGWVILALGKLGAEELNYSSDIDLIILHDPHSTPLFAPETAQQFYVEMTRSLVRILSQATADGIGWRVDLRLRPDPGATAVSIQIGAALGYYESIARTWERAAFIRARPIAGDLGLGAAFLADIQPFVWRRTLDYTVMDDMKSMLRRPPQMAGWAGYNLKAGKNGIRQIEFFTHVLQLVTGGRAPAIRLRRTLPALQALADDNWISTEQAEMLGRLYHGLRRVEHRLQMLADAQTHSLPRSQNELAQFARFMGHADAHRLLAALAAVMQAVGTQTSHKLLAEDTGTATTLVEGERPVPMRLDDEEELMAWLESRGFSRPADICATLNGWMAGRIAATRGERARALLHNLMPGILENLGRGASPDDQFAAFAQFAEGLPASVQIFSLLDHNRQLTKLLCDVLVLSPRMAAYLRRYPTLFDLVLFDEFFVPLAGADMLQAKLEEAIADSDIETALDEIKRRTREWRFQAEVQALSRVLPTAGLSLTLTAIADAVVRVVHQLARRDMERRHGHIAGDCAVLALGRHGVGGLTARSDLDLVVVYSAAEGAQSSGTRSIGAATYFARLTQTFVNWLSSSSAEGSLYEVDMRLRPDGDKGGIAVHIDRFQDYYAEDAWLWEKLALAKARIVSGPRPESSLRDRLAGTIMKTVGTPVDATEVSRAIHDMCARLRKTYGDAPALRLRKQPGGLAELDLLIQGLRLVHADCFAGSGQDPLAILDILVSADRLTTAQAAALVSANLLFTTVHSNLRLCLGAFGQNVDGLSPAVTGFLVETADAADAAQLVAMLAAERSVVEGLFEQLFPAQDPPPAAQKHRQR